MLAFVRTGEDIRSPGSRERVERVAERISDDPAVARVLTFYDTRNLDRVSEDGESAYVVGFDPAADGDVVLGGGAVVGPQVGETVGEDLARAEPLACPVLFGLSLRIFRGVVAALLPMPVGGIAIVGTFLRLRVVNAERGRGGMVLMGSLVGFQGAPNAAHYAATRGHGTIPGSPLKNG